MQTVSHNSLGSKLQLPGHQALKSVVQDKAKQTSLPTHTPYPSRLSIFATLFKNTHTKLYRLLVVVIDTEFTSFRADKRGL